MWKKYRTILLVIVPVQLLFLVIQLFSQNYLLDDSNEYLLAADNLIHQGVLYCGNTDAPEDPALYTKRPPGYPLFLAATRLFTPSHLPVIILQMLLSLVSILLMLEIFQPQKKEQFILLLFLLLIPAQYIYANMVMAEILFQCVIMLAAYRLLLYLRTKRIRTLWSYQAFIIFAILIKPDMYLFVVPNIILFTVLYYKTHQRLLIISSLIPVVFLIIFGGFNQQRTGHFHISSIQQIKLVDNNLYYFLVDRDGEAAAAETLERIHATCRQERDFNKRSACLSHAATSILKDDPALYALFHLKGMARFFLDPGRFDLSSFFGIEKEQERGFLYQLNAGGTGSAWRYLWEQPLLLIITLLLTGLVNLLRAVGFLCALFNKQFSMEFRLFLFLLVGTLAFASGPLGAARHMLPVALLLTGSAAVQYGQWIRMIYRYRLQKRATAP
jgi:hypothetical protein